MVTLHTIDGGTVNAINDALLYDFIIGQNGIATGATVTSEGALLLHIDSGWGVIKGRIFSIEAETVNATPSTSGTVKGRLILQIDITNTTNPITFVTQAAATLPALQQEDINGNGTIFQLPIATYDVNEVAVSNLQMVAPVVKAINDRIETIWNNNDIKPMSEMEIPLNTPSYKIIIVIALTSLDGGINDLTTGIIDPTIKNKVFFISRASYINLYRGFTVTLNSIKVTNGFKQNNFGTRVVDANVIIPTKVLGIR